MADFNRREGESVLSWERRLVFVNVLGLNAKDEDDLHRQRGLAAEAVEDDQRRAVGLARETAESEALRRCKAAVRSLPLADQQALLEWQQGGMPD